MQQTIQTSSVSAAILICVEQQSGNPNFDGQHQLQPRRRERKKQVKETARLQALAAANRNPFEMQSN